MELCQAERFAGKNTILVVRFYTKVIILPRQARDKHSEKLNKEYRFHGLQLPCSGLTRRPGDEHAALQPTLKLTHRKQQAASDLSTIQRLSHHRRQYNQTRQPLQDRQLMGQPRQIDTIPMHVTPLMLHPAKHLQALRVGR